MAPFMHCIHASVRAGSQAERKSVPGTSETGNASQVMVKR